MIKKKKEWRILLHAMTFKRDFGTMFILARILEKLGCKCFISNNTDGCSKRVRMWNPHAVFYVTMGRTKRFKNTFPKAKLFLCSGEGGESREKVNEIDIITDRNLSNAIDRVYLWGSAAEGYVKDKIDEVGDASPFFQNESLFKKQFTMAGNPRIDLIRYNSPKTENSKKIKVGLIGAFSFINNYSYRLLSVLANRMSFPHIKVDIEFQLRMLRLYWEIVKDIDVDKYELSLRPYPLEGIKEYYNADFVKDGRVLIDNSLDFSTWMMDQDIIIGPISSTISQIVVSGKPFLCIDKICGRSEVAYEKIPVALRNIAEAHSPDTEEEFYTRLENKSAIEIKDKAFEANLHKHYNSSVDHSVLLQIAVDMIQTLEEEEKKPTGFSIPFKFLSYVNDLKLRYIKYRNPNIDEIDYSFFRYQEVKDKAKAEFSGIVENILNDKNNEKFLNDIMKDK